MNKLKKRFSALRGQRRGFTLVEISVGVILLLLVMAMSTSILIFTINMANRSARLNERKLTGDELYYAVTQRLGQATHIALQPADTPVSNAKYSHVLQVTEGTIRFGTRAGGFTEIYTPAGLNGADMELTSHILSDGVLELGLTITDTARIEQYHTQSALRLLNIYDKLSLTDKDTGAKLGLKIENLAGAEQSNLLISYEFTSVTVKDTYGEGDGPYTVDKQYKPPEGVEVKPLEPGKVYNYGDYVLGSDGKLYIVSWELGGVSLEPSIDAVGRWRCIEDGTWNPYSNYRLGDVVIGSDGNFYMAQRDNATWYDPADSTGRTDWMRVYWCQEKADEHEEEDENITGGKLRGWSVADSAYYVCAFDIVKTHGHVEIETNLPSDTMIKNQSEMD